MKEPCITIVVAFCCAACHDRASPRHRADTHQVVDSAWLTRLAANTRTVDSFNRAHDSIEAVNAAWQNDSGLVVIFALEGNGPERTLDPIAVRDRNDSLRQPPIGEGTELPLTLFNRRWYGAGQRYLRVLDGARAGIVVAGNPTQAGCEGLEGDAKLEPNHAVIVAGGIVITDTASNSAPIVVTEPSSADSAALRELALGLVSDSQGRWVTRLLEVRHAAILRTPRLSAPLAIAAYHAGLSGDSTPDRNPRTVSIVVIAEKQPSGMHVTWRQVDESGGEMSDVRDFIDFVDIDRDGMPEIILGNQHYESNDYWILTHRTGTWSLLYQGGGGGC